MTIRELTTVIALDLGIIAALRPACREVGGSILAYDILPESAAVSDIGPIDKTIDATALGIGGATAASLLFCRQNRKKEDEIPESIK